MRIRPIGHRERMPFKHPVDVGDGRGRFDAAAEAASNFTSRPPFFAFCVLLGIAWVLVYVLHAGHTVQHVIGDAFGVLALLLVAILKNSERRAEYAMHQKLDALLAAALQERERPAGDRDRPDAREELQRALQLHDEV
jgi:low affinity Fe/Cu permease